MSRHDAPPRLTAEEAIALDAHRVAGELRRLAERAEAVPFSPDARLAAARLVELRRELLQVAHELGPEAVSAP